MNVSAVAIKNLDVDAPATLTLIPNQTSPIFTISGGKLPYQVVSANQGVATVAFSGSSTFTINGVSAGQTDIQVKDANGTIIKISVTVNTAALYTTAPSSITLLPSSTTSFSVSGGEPAYSVTSSNPSVATVTALSANTYQINASANQGQADLIVTDSKGTKLTTMVDVKRDASAVLTVNPLAITGRVGETLTFVVSDGVANYTVVSSDASIVQATMVGNQVSATLLGSSLEGGVTLVVRDAVGQTKEVTVTSLTTTADLRLAPEELTISECDGSNLTFTIYGGAGPYEVYSSNLTLLPQGAVTGNQVTFAGQTRAVTANVDVLISVVDSFGASTSSTLTIANEATCP